jgi:hypothetical protein
MWGQVIHFFSLFSSPVMYWAGTPSRLRKRRISQKKTTSVSRNQKPTIQKISEKTKSMSAEKVA